MAKSASSSFTGCFVGLITMINLLTGCGDARDWHKFSGESTVTVVTPDVQQPAPDATVDTSNNEDGACTSAIDCDDEIKSTVDTCVDGACVHKTITCPAGQTFNELGECIKVIGECPQANDEDPCTQDLCSVDTGEVMNPPIDCTDSSEFTVDSCNPKTGHCDHTLKCPGDCADESPCTTGECTATGCVQHVIDICPQGFVCAIDGACAKHCSADADCADSQYCTLDSCNMEFGYCENSPRKCDDQDPTTTDFCAPGDEDNTGKCESAASECTGGCDDQDQCTDDLCQDGECVHYPPAICGAGTTLSTLTCKCEISLDCQSDAECDDGNACSDDDCEFGSCNHAVLDECDDGEICDSVTGQCKKLDECPSGCDDGNFCTADVCESGVCLHKGGVSTCGPGTSLNPTNCKCEIYQDAPQCIDGQKACLEMGGTGTVSWVLCAQGKYWQISNCGSFNTCQPLTGCMAPPASGGPASNPPASNPPATCIPSCSNKTCGSNGCGGSCGTCGAGTTCDATGQCVVASNVDQLSITWVKPSQGVPSDVSKFVLASECKLGSTVKVNFHYLLTDPDSVVVNATANSVNFTKVVGGLKGSACKSNVFGYNSAGTAIWYAVKDSNLTTVGTLSYSYNGTSVSNVGVGSNNQGGGDYLWVVP